MSAPILGKVAIDPKDMRSRAARSALGSRQQRKDIVYLLSAIGLAGSRRDPAHRLAMS